MLNAIVRHKGSHGGVPDAIVDAAGLIWQMANLLASSSSAQSGQQVLDTADALQRRGLVDNAPIAKIRATAQEGLLAAAPSSGQLARARTPSTPLGRQQE